CDCSVQFVSNIEHGRAPLPWEKVDQLASILKIPVAELQAANLAIRSDFKSFVGAKSVVGLGKGRKTAKPAILKALMAGTASTVAFAARDNQLQEVIQRYQSATPASRKKFVRAALEMLGV